jgi:hypothetical protein
MHMRDAGEDCMGVYKLHTSLFHVSKIWAGANKLKVVFKTKLSSAVINSGLTLNICFKLCREYLDVAQVKLFKYL